MNLAEYLENKRIQLISSDYRYLFVSY